MDEFYKDLNQLLFYKWILLNTDYYKSQHIDFYVDEKEEETLHFDTENYLGTISFWKNGILEETILEKKTYKALFYLHFQIAHFAQAQNLFKEFIEYLSQDNRKAKRILLCCSGGLSTTYFASKLQEIAGMYHENYEFEATGVYRLQEEILNYDLVVLAPQISYLEPYIKRNFFKTIPVICFKSTIFATNNYYEAFKFIQNYIKENQM